MLLLSLTVTFTWLAQHTRGSLLLAHLVHQAFNGWVEAIPYFPEAIPYFPTVTGSLAPFLVMVGALTVGAALIVRRWSVHAVTRQRRLVRSPTAPSP